MKKSRTPLRGTSKPAPLAYLVHRGPKAQRPAPKAKEVLGPPTSHSTQQRMERFVQELAALTDKAGRTKIIRDWLNATAALWEYSVHNRMLIRAQRKDAEFVAGRIAWAERGRTVRADARGIWILRPGSSRRFIGVKVYDVRDTDGPEVIPPRFELNGRTARLGAIERAVARFKVKITNGPLPRRALGVAIDADTIAVRPNLPPREQVAVLLHELAHVLLHFRSERPKDNRVCEAEAEAVAYIVARALGEPSKAPVYLAAHRVSGTEILASMKRTSDAAQRILNAIAPRRSRRRESATAVGAAP